ncbi:hypothetical protein ACK8HY_14135 [Sphingobacterium sp. NGMCC 1.201703]|uniref:hypothetical protein n=1 Tax=Sphingobacterium sp. NGMCC 1.201703 TaxID=3388657 RepID=UPI0039FC6803
MKIVIIDHEPFSQRKISHYYIDEFLQDKVEVEYWDVSGTLFYTKHVVYAFKEEKEYVRVFEDYRTLLEEVEKLDHKNTMIILEVFFRSGTDKLFKKIREKGIKWARLNYYHNPTAILGDRITLRKKLLKILNPKIIWDKFQLLFLNQAKYAQPDLLFVTGRLGSENNTNTVSLDFFDVEEYRKQKGKNNLPPFHGSYMVFLDIMFSSHPDFKRLRIDTIDENVYFKKLCSFFDQLERRFKMPIVIASHPKANYSKEFGDRVVIKNLTAELVKDADLVITHGSLSICYALLELKPLLYVYFEEMRLTKKLAVYYRRMVRACESLGSSLVSVEDNLDSLELRNVDKKKYESFLNEVYLKGSDDTRSNYEIIKDSFIELIK